MARSILFLLAVLAAPATAQSLPDWATATGRFALGHTDRVPGADAFLAGDATLRFAAPGSRFGVALGVYGRADALDTPHETYGALTFDIGTGRLSAGVPRPAYDGFAVSALEEAFPSLAIDRTAATRSAATAGAMFGNWLPYGVAFTNAAGGLSYAVSVHHAEAPGETVVGVGMATQAGPWALSGAVESVGGEVSGKAQVVRQFDRVTAGLGLYAPQAAGVSGLVEGFATVWVFDPAEVTGVIQVPTDGGADPTAGLAVRYGVREGVDLSVGVASDAGAAAAVSAFVDFRF